MCMEMTVAQVARQHARTDRFVQQALRSGALSGHRVFGRTTSVDDVADRLDVIGRAAADNSADYLRTRGPVDPL